MDYQNEKCCACKKPVAFGDDHEPVICDCGNLIFPSDVLGGEREYMITYYPAGFSLN